MHLIGAHSARPILAGLATLCFVTLPIAAQSPPRFEYDFIFPRNDSYFPTSVFPIAVAIQNLSAVTDFSDAVISWDIMPYSQGVVPGGILYDSGDFTLPTPGSFDPNSPVVLVSSTNASEWISRKRDVDEQYMLNFHVVWPEVRDACGHNDTNVFGGIMLAVANRASTRPLPAGIPSPKEPDVLALPECPAAGSVVEIAQDPEVSSCSVVNDNVDPAQANPCAVRIDSATASDIFVRASSTASSRQAATAEPPRPTSTSSTAAAAATWGAGAIPTVVAAACVLGSLYAI